MQQFITFPSENNQMTCPAVVKFWAAKATKIIRFCLLRNADISKQFCLTYWNFGKKMTKRMFFFPSCGLSDKWKLEKSESVVRERKNLKGGGGVDSSQLKWG